MEKSPSATRSSFGKRRGCRPQRRSQAQAQAEQSTHARTQENAGPIPTLREVARRVEFRSVIRAPSRKFKILAILNVIAHGKSYKHGFTNKLDSHILCAKSHAESSFDRFFVVEFRSVFRAPSRKFKILAIPDVLGHESCFDRFFVYDL
ncbi:hypothetical protein BHM03_00051613 [Ensete ventricosum]|nr:hypothetical protein BHM03_00051613 [Ensete ventricosum]